ncbi:MAG: peptidoglycan D,D-transpeptidase FtsI family protein, partial [Ktedonobacterales bacterium]
MSRSTPNTPRAGSPMPGEARSTLIDALRDQRARDRSERGTLIRAQWRQGVIFLLIVAALGALLLRTAYWQLEIQRTLADRADAEHLRAISLPTGRGEILDARGRLLALSVTEDTVIADPDVIRAERALDTSAQALATMLGLSQASVRGQLDVPGAYVRLRDANGQVVLATQAQSAALGAAIGNGTLPGIALIPAVRRVYPAGGLAGQALGFVRVSDGVGQYGIEQQLQATLAGKPGVLYTAVDATGNPLATGVRRETPAVPGANVTLTLDANVQYWAEQGLADAIAQTGARGGTVIVMDPHTGAIIALANLPSFDPNLYSNASLASFVDPAVSTAYDPGSVMKGVTIAAGIDSGAIMPGSIYDDEAPIRAGGVTIHNWDRRNYGPITMTQVLQYSANTGAIWVAQQVGHDRFDRYLSAFGFGQRTGVDLPTESAGLLAQPQSRADADLLLAENAFGESIAVTPLQMVTAYGALANGGVLMRPYIVASVTGDGGQGAVTRTGSHAVRQVVSAATAQTVTQMLVQSAYRSEAEMYRVQGYTVAAKTGTSTPDAAHPQVTYASVIGYAPASNPRFVMLVKLDHPRETIYGGTAAGPLWRSL